MAERIVYTLFGAFLVIAAIAINNHTPIVKAEDNVQVTNNEQAVQPIKTQSTFTTKTIETTEKLLAKTVYKDDPEIEAGEETVFDQGSDGKKTIITKITYHEGEEYDREIIGTEIVEPKDKIISRGTKIVWKTLQTSDGEIRYWKKIRVWTTHYDSHCPGCNDWTAIGMKATKGVIAVDPTIIKMRTKVYVPGYGPAVAGDTGGAIKGNIIDLCFDDAKTAGWHAQFVDIYLLD